MQNCDNNQSSDFEGIILILYFVSVVHPEIHKLFTGNLNTWKWEGFVVFMMEEESDCVTCTRFP